MSGALLDTCAVIWVAENRLPSSVAALVAQYAAANELYFSAISAWEIGMLGRPRREGPRVRFEPDPVSWFTRFRGAPGLREARLSTEIAMASALLPEGIHGDPADRILIATAKSMGIPLVTSDRRIIDYAAQGFLDVIECRPDPDTNQ